MFDTIYKTFSAIDKNINKPLALIITSSPFWYIFLNLYSHWSIVHYGKDFAIVLSICMGLVSTIYLLGLWFISDFPYYYDKNFLKQSEYEELDFSFTKSLRPYISAFVFNVLFFSAEILFSYDIEKETVMKTFIFKYIRSYFFFCLAIILNNYSKWIVFRKSLKRKANKETIDIK
ncbi:MAG: hypothetical protein ACO1PI_15120 [Bacteroidota bacterium]